VKKNRSVFLGMLALSVILILATGCFRPAAPDATPSTSGGAEAATPEESALEATAMANSTRAAQTAEAQTAEAETGEEAEEGEEGEEEEEEQQPTETSAEPAATTPAVPATATPTSPPATQVVTIPPADTPVPSGTGTTHVVQPGENLFRIALRYGTTVEAIAQANGIADATQLSVGQKLTIPAGGDQPSQPPVSGDTYVVRPGDNLFRIALRFNMSYLRLAEYNGIDNPANIYVGQVLRIPPR